ncbi:MAG: hypothetical protein JJU03_08585 [Idiomarina sp.]|nr:hypothetical protein [Idiomarina sp.]
MPLNLCIRRLIVLLFLLGALPGCSASSRTADNFSPDINRLLEHAEYIHRAGARHELIWQNFWDHEQGFLLYIRQGPALLYTHSTPIPGGDQVAPHTYLYADGLERLTDSIFLRYPLPETTVTAVVLQSNGEQTAGLLFHEAFHAWQSTHFKQRMDSRYVNDDAFADPHVRALLQMRREVLSTALTHQHLSANTVGALRTIDDLLRENLGDSIIERLYQLELIEGSAELVGTRAQILSLPETTRRIDFAASLRANLVDGLSSRQGSVHSASDLRFYAYGTGAASAYILAQLDPNYQRMLATELVDQQILSQLNLPAEPPSPARLYRQLRYSHWLDWATRDEQTERSLSLSNFAALTPATLDIRINMHSAAAAAALNVNFSSGLQGFSQPLAGSYMLPEPLSVSVHGANTSLLIEGPATHLMSPRDDTPALRLQIKVESLPALCSFNPDGTRVLTCELDSLSLDWEGVQFEHKATTTIEQRGQSLYINVDEL